MDIATSKLTVLFEDPFWIGIYEREWAGVYEVCKITFGAEPKTSELYDFILQDWHKLCFSPSIETEILIDKHPNPKRLQREINKNMQDSSIGTKAQQALKLQLAQGKLERRSHSRDIEEAKRERLFALHQAKRKEKHRGH